mmetsp:Transcript_3390/g.4599  ORF Transcript_3390/g.4599 Transcript_3390/m.4599 type:complete len:103 (-) Transcript_3390:533-841(-)
MTRCHDDDDLERIDQGICYRRYEGLIKEELEFGIKRFPHHDTVIANMSAAAAAMVLNQLRYYCILCNHYSGQSIAQMLGVQLIVSWIFVIIIVITVVVVGAS